MHPATWKHTHDIASPTYLYRKVSPITTVSIPLTHPTGHFETHSDLLAWSDTSVHMTLQAHAAYLHHDSHAPTTVSTLDSPCHFGTDIHRQFPGIHHAAPLQAQPACPMMLHKPKTITACEYPLTHPQA